MIPLSPEEAGRALGLGAISAPVSGVSIDSRTIRPGDLFVALRGERFDGHDFVPAALAAGASGAVVEKKRWEAQSVREGLTSQTTVGAVRAEEARQGPIYAVDDTYRALGALAGQVRGKSEALVFAVTGSVGKTSTKDLLTAMVGRMLRTTATLGSQNNEVGVPLTLFALDPDSEALIVEMGMRGRGQIAALASIAEPNVGIITNVHPVHLELLGTLENIAEAKAELAMGLRQGGVLVAPADCAVLRRYLRRAARRTVYFGVGRQAGDAEVRGWLDEGARGSGQVMTICWPEGKAQVEISSLASYQVENIVAAAAGCYAAALPMERCLEGVEEACFSGGRGQVVQLAGICLIDDTYNANPVAVKAALEELVRLAAAGGGRPVAVLGDMLELGVSSEGYHREVGRYAAELGVQGLWGVGPRARAMAQGFREAWRERGPAVAEVTVGHVGSADEGSAVVDSLRPGDVVLFKGSRAMRLERMVGLVTALAQAGAWSERADTSAIGETAEAAKQGQEGSGQCSS